MRRRLAILGMLVAILLAWVAGHRMSPHAAPPPASDVVAPVAAAPPLGAMPGAVEVVESKEANLDLDPPAPPVSLEPVTGEICGRVLDPAGRPTRAEVFLFGTSDWMGPQKLPTDAEGRFRCVPEDGLAAPYRIVVRASHVGWADPVAATPGGEATTVALHGSRKFRVTVLDDAGKPVDAYVSYSPSDSAELGLGYYDEARSLATPTDWTSSDTDAHGVAVLEVFRWDRRGELSVHPSSSEDRERLRDHEDLHWLPRERTIRLAPRLCVKGTVRDGAGIAQTDGWVAWREADGLEKWVDIEDDGTFWITDLPPGPVVLEPRFKDLGVPDDAFRKEVQAGDRDVVLTVDLAKEIDVRVDGWPSEARNGYALLSALGPDAGPKPFRSPIDAHGVSRFRGVTPGARYAVFVPCSSADLVEFGAEGDVHRIAYREGLSAGATITTVKLVAGRSVSGRIDLSQVPAQDRDDVLRGALVSVTDGPVRASCRPDGDGAFVLHGLPEGTWTVQALDEAAGWSARATTGSGESSPITLELTRQADPASSAASHEKDR